MAHQFVELAQRRESKIFQSLSELVAFPSVSPGGGDLDACVKCADHLKSKLEGMSFKVQQLPLDGNPIIFAERHIGDDKPTVLYYGHYDVQPAGDAKKWNSDPYTLTVNGLRWVGRGAQDNKGQTTTTLEGLSAMIEEGILDCNIKIILEGEEESGSTRLSRAALDPQFADLIKADILLVCDTDAHALGRMGITIGLRGIAMTVFSIHGPSKGLHSGLFGGVGTNPVEGISKVISSFRSDDGAFAVKGFVDSVREISDEDAARVLETAKTEDQIREFTGWKSLDGEPGFSPQIRATLRPAIEFTCVAGGEMGKNEIPTHATARIAARLTRGQDPETALHQIQDHLREHTPRGTTLEIHPGSRAMPGLEVDPRNVEIERAAAAIEAITNQPPGYLYSGGSIPIIPTLSRISGATPILLGAGLEEDNIHGDNESFHSQQAILGFATVCELLRRIGARGAA